MKIDFGSRFLREIRTQKNPDDQYKKKKKDVGQLIVTIILFFPKSWAMSIGGQWRLHIDLNYDLVRKGDQKVSKEKQLQQLIHPFRSSCKNFQVGSQIKMIKRYRGFKKCLTLTGTNLSFTVEDTRGELTSGQRSSWPSFERRQLQVRRHVYYKTLVTYSPKMIFFR